MSFFLYILARSILKIMPGSANLEILRKTPNNNTLLAVFLLNEERPKLLCVLGIGHVGIVTLDS